MTTPLVKRDICRPYSNLLNKRDPDSQFDELLCPAHVNQPWQTMLLHSVDSVFGLDVWLHTNPSTQHVHTMPS
eukprot:363137-Chlamydomonas_euryale.AAC.8